MSSNSAGGSSAPSPRLLQPLPCLLARHGDQVVQLQHPALAGLERLAVRPVHGAEADVLQRARRRVAGQLGGAEHLLEVVGLPLVDHVEHQARDPARARRSKMVARSVVPYMAEPFGRDHQQRRQLALVALAAPPARSARPGPRSAGPWPADPRPCRDQRIGVALALPQVEVDAERVELALQRRVRLTSPNWRHMRAVAAAPGLQLGGGPAGAVAVVRARPWRGRRRAG